MSTVKQYYIGILILLVCAFIVVGIGYCNGEFKSPEQKTYIEQVKK